LPFLVIPLAESIILANYWVYTPVGGPIFTIGISDDISEYDTIDAINWDYLAGLFAPPYILEYTTNTMFYDISINNVIIDVTGLGVSDTCNKLVRIAANQSEWSL